MLIAALSLSRATAALAAAPDETAKNEFQRGREAFKQGDYRSALPHFRKSQQLSPQVGTLLNLASCEEKLGLVASARHHFQEAVSQLPARDDRVSFAQERISALEPRVARLRVKLGASAAPSTRVDLDGSPMPEETLDAELPVDPGKHEITANAPGMPEGHYEVTLQEGERSAITVEPGGGHPPAPYKPEEPVKWWTSKRIAGVALGGAGVVGIGVGAVTGAIALSTKSSLVKLCPMPKDCTPDGVAKANTGKTLSVASTVGFVVGTAVAAAGVVLILTGGESAAKASAAVRVSPLPGGGALGFEGRF